MTDKKVSRKGSCCWKWCRDERVPMAAFCADHLKLTFDAGQTTRRGVPAEMLIAWGVAPEVEPQRPRGLLDRVLGR